MLYFFEKFCILNITKNLKNKERITAMLKQRLYNAKSNNESKQCATTGMPWSVCDFTGSVYSFNDCGEQKYAWSKRRLKCWNFDYTQGLRYIWWILQYLTVCWKYIQAGGFFLFRNRHPGWYLSRSLVRIFLTNVDGTGTRILKKEKKEKNMKTRFYTV